ncbi:MAG: panE [Mucilaginibacter sp.]|nr:panE [Mucilaginibacter sp.]
MINDNNKVYIVGLGALGSMYAAKLYDIFPAGIKIIADENRVKAFQQTGITVNGKPYFFDFILPSDKQPPADLIIIAVKNIHLQQAIQDIRGFIGEDTIVISLLNGILSEEQIGQAIGTHHLLYAYGVGMDALRKDNTTTYTNPGKIVFGEKQNTVLSDRVKAVKDLFERAQIPYQIPEDMNRALWSKFMMNTGINQASAVLRAPYGVFQQNEEARKLMLMAAEEVMALSQKCDINLNQADIDNFMQIIYTLHPSGKTSMLQDMEAGRKTEADIFAGTVIELGKKYNVPTPVNETLYCIIQVTEQTALI